MGELDTIVEHAQALVGVEREKYLDQVCKGDAEMRHLVVRRLAAAEEAERFFGETQKSPRDLLTSLAHASEGPGDVIGRYKLREKIGEGGCGVVYVADQEEPVRRRVALKLIRLGMDTATVIARFEAERQALALMDHPNIARVLDAGSTQTGRPYFVMELVRGIKITDYCDQNNLLTHDRLDLFVKVCQAVQHAHQKGVIHRDIKPSNILVTLHDGVPVPKVIDFGIAKATEGRLTDATIYTELHQFIGTPAYMSPEQAEMSGLDVDTRTDIYSLGVLLYELLTGKTPFDGRELIQAGLDEMRRTIREKEPVRPSTRLGTMLREELTTTAKRRQCEAPKLINLLRGDLDWIVMKALEKDRARRYDTATGFASDVCRYLQNEAVTARPPSNLYRLNKLVRRNRLAFAAAAAIALTLLAGFAVSTWLYLSQKAASHRAIAAEESASRALKNEESQRKLAEQSAGQTRRTLSASDFAHAVRLIEAGDETEALPFLVRSLTANPANSAAMVRLSSLLTQGAWLVPGRVFKFEKGLNGARVSPDGRRFVTSCDKEVRLWDFETGAMVKNLTQGAWPETLAVHFSPDGGLVAAASSEGALQFWDGRSGEVRTPELRLGAPVTEVNFSPDGRSLVAALYDASLARFVDTTTGRESGAPLKHDTNLISAVFSPDGRQVASSTVDGLIHFWDVERRTENPVRLVQDSPALGLHYSPDGKLLATAGMDGIARVWDLRTRSVISQTIKANLLVSQVQFSPDGLRLLTACSDGVARVWDVRTGRPLSAPLKHKGPITLAQFMSGGDQIVTGSWDRTMRVWNTLKGVTTPPALVHSGLRSAQMSPDGKRVVTASMDGTARVWDISSGRVAGAALVHNGPVLWAEFSPDGSRILTTSMDGTAQLWDAVKHVPLCAPLEHSGPVRFGQFSPDGQRVVTASNQSIDPVAREGTRAWERSVKAEFRGRVWDAKTGQAVTDPFPAGTALKSISFSSDSKNVLTSSLEGIQWIDAGSGRMVTGPLREGTMWFTDFWNPPGVAQVNPGGIHAVSASTDDSFRVWSLKSGELVFPAVQQPGIVWTAQFSPSGDRIATAAKGNLVRIWDASTGAPVTPPIQHSGCTSAQFSPDGLRLLTTGTIVGFNSTARVWDTESGLPLTGEFQLGGRMLTAQFSRDGRRILCASEDGQAVVWELGPAFGMHPPWLLQLAESISGDRLNAFGVLEPVEADPAESLNELRQQLRRASADDVWAAWGRWLLNNPNTRNITASSTVTAVEYADNARKAPLARSLVSLRPEHVRKMIAVQESVQGFNRSDIIFREGKWKEARTELARAFEADQRDVETSVDLFWRLTALELHLRDQEAYDRHRNSMLGRFAGSESESVFGVAVASLLAPAKGESLRMASELAERSPKLIRKFVDGKAVPVTEPALIAWTEFAEALAGYRRGEFQFAVQKSARVLEMPAGSAGSALQACASFVQAMSHHGLRRSGEAQSAMAKGVELTRSAGATGNPGALGDGWHFQFSAEILMREAEGLLRVQSATSE